ncbi:MAG: hypothetical protein V4509_00115 [Patescibacteria group bacterium]
MKDQLLDHLNEHLPAYGLFVLILLILIATGIAFPFVAEWAGLPKWRWHRTQQDEKQFGKPFILKPGEDKNYEYSDGTLTVWFTGVNEGILLLVLTFIFKEKRPEKERKGKDDDGTIAICHRLQLHPGATIVPNRLPAQHHLSVLCEKIGNEYQFKLSP